MPNHDSSQDYDPLDSERNKRFSKICDREGNKIAIPLYGILPLLVYFLINPDPFSRIFICILMAGTIWYIIHHIREANKAQDALHQEELQEFVKDGQHEKRIVEQIMSEEGSHVSMEKSDRRSSPSARHGD